MRTLKKFMIGVLSVMFLTGVFFFAGGFEKESHAQGGGDQIVVKKGDTLYQLAKQYGTSVKWLKEENNLTSDKIYVGQKLVVPNQTQNESLYVIIAGSFSKKANADKRVSFLKQKGIDAVVVKKIINDNQYYRIQTGAFSKRANAEKQRKVIQSSGVQDAYIVAEKTLQIKGVSLGSNHNEFIEQFGSPLFYEEKSNIQSHYYVDEGAGVRATFNSSDGRINQLQIYPEFLRTQGFPQSKQNVIQVYGYPNGMETVSCYESAFCQQLHYQFNGDQLTVQIDQDGKTVQFMDLKKLQ